MGLVRRSYNRGQRFAGAGLRHAKHFRQYRELTDDCLQRRQHEFPGSHPGRFGGLAAGRRRRLSQAPLRRITVQGAIQTAHIRDGYGDQRRWLSSSSKIRPASTGPRRTSSGVDSYTRRGDFELNANGYLVNGAGYYLEGIPIDPTTGVPIGNVAAPLQFQNNFLPASATTQINYGINLPATPSTHVVIIRRLPIRNCSIPRISPTDPTVAGTGRSSAATHRLSSTNRSMVGR